MTLAGTTIGPIRLVELLGEGGMGEVYLGIDERLGRRVAVKAVRGARRADPLAAARFRREARILSRLEHPNVCRLYELIEGDGHDLLVMELVEGRTLRRAMEDGLEPRERWQVAEQVCAALVAAHALSVVHRDLKPENVMLGADGTVKVLDFGIARSEPLHATDDPRAADGTGDGDAPDRDGPGVVRTVRGSVVGTPESMSPEQARGEDVTAASDMFSFGLLLQELFTGRPALAPGLARAEILRKIQWGETAPADGAPPPVRRLIERLKSLSPDQRPSAEETQRRLRWIRDRPRRAVRRLAVAAVAASLVAGTLASVGGLVRSRRALDAERRARAEAEAVSGFLRSMLASAQPDEQGIDVKVVDVLDGAAAHLDDAFADEPLRAAAVRMTLARTYQGLGIYPAAREQAERARTTYEALRGPGHADTLSARYVLAQLSRQQGDLAGAEREIRAVADGRRALLGPDDVATLDALQELSVVLRRRGETEEAERLIRDLLGRQSELFGPDHPETLESRLGLANLLVGDGRHGEAEVLYRDLADTYRDLSGPEHPDTLLALNNMASSMSDRGELREAEAIHARVLAARRRVLGPSHPDTLLSLRNHAVVLRRLERFDEAEAELEEAYRLTVDTLGREHPATAMAIRSLAVLAKKRRQLDRAAELYLEELEIERRVLGADHPSTLVTLGNLANVRTAQDRYDEAEEIYLMLLPLQRAALGEDHPEVLTTRSNLAGLHLEMGRVEEAEAGFREAVARGREVLGADHQLTLFWEFAVGACLAERGALPEAEEVLADVLERSERLFGPDHPRPAAIRELLEQVRAGG